mgnify:CR=1 FL=1|jgi:glycosyltransferase involved in cell wall biosynthesis
MFLSICIPNFNRAKSLNNCLNSILISKKNSNLDLEICISDNCSTENIDEIVKIYNKYLNIKFKKNSSNLGFGKNAINSVSIATGEFVWILGNDDLLLPNTLSKLENLIKRNKNIDFFFINSFNLNSKIVFDSTQPFNTNNLPKNMKKFSMINKDKIVSFFDLIDPQISFDFLLGIYLSIFRRKNWEENTYLIDQKAIEKKGLWSTFDNTCPHIKIFSRAFSKSKAYLHSEPLSINLSGEREWSDLYTFIESIRIPEILDQFFKEGLSKKKYLICKNFSLRNILPALIKIILNGDKAGLKYIKFIPHVFKNMIFPNFYYSPIRFILKKIIN